MTDISCVTLCRKTDIKNGIQYDARILTIVVVVYVLVILGHISILWPCSGVWAVF